MGSRVWFLVYVLLGSQAALGQEFRSGTPEGYLVARTAERPSRKPIYMDRDYHWVRGRQVQMTQGGMGGPPLHGAYMRYAESGQLREAGKFDQGLKDGEWRRWDPQGRLLVVESWKDGQLHGTVRRFPAADGPVVEEKYRRGQLRQKTVKAEKSDQKAKRTWTPFKQKSGTTEGPTTPDGPTDAAEPAKKKKGKEGAGRSEKATEKEKKATKNTPAREPKKKKTPGPKGEPDAETN